MKILYVHGYNGKADGDTFKMLSRLAKVVSEDIEVVGAEYNQYDCDEAHEQIMKKFRNEKADIIIGSSLGGFLVMTCTEIKHRIVRILYKILVETSSLNRLIIESCSTCCNRRHSL